MIDIYNQPEIDKITQQPHRNYKNPGKFRASQWPKQKMGISTNYKSTNHSQFRFNNNIKKIT